MKKNNLLYVSKAFMQTRLFEEFHLKDTGTKLELTTGVTLPNKAGVYEYSYDVTIVLDYAANIINNAELLVEGYTFDYSVLSGDGLEKPPLFFSYFREKTVDSYTRHLNTLEHISLDSKTLGLNLEYILSDVEDEIAGRHVLNTGAVIELTKPVIFQKGLDSLVETVGDISEISFSRIKQLTSNVDVDGLTYAYELYLTTKGKIYTQYSVHDYPHYDCYVTHKYNNETVRYRLGVTESYSDALAVTAEQIKLESNQIKEGSKQNLKGDGLMNNTVKNQLETLVTFVTDSQSRTAYDVKYTHSQGHVNFEITSDVYVLKGALTGSRVTIGKFEAPLDNIVAKAEVLLNTVEGMEDVRVVIWETGNKDIVTLLEHHGYTVNHHAPDYVYEKSGINLE